MLAEIFMLKAEATARESKAFITVAPFNSFPSSCRRRWRNRRPFQVFAKSEPRTTNAREKPG